MTKRPFTVTFLWKHKGSLGEAGLLCVLLAHTYSYVYSALLRSLKILQYAVKQSCLALAGLTSVCSSSSCRYLAFCTTYKLCGIAWIQLLTQLLHRVTDAHFQIYLCILCLLSATYTIMELGYMSVGFVAVPPYCSSSGEAQQPGLCRSVYHAINIQCA